MIDLTTVEVIKGALIYTAEELQFINGKKGQ